MEEQEYSDTIDALHAIWADLNYLINDSKLIDESDKLKLQEASDKVDDILVQLEDDLKS